MSGSGRGRPVRRPAATMALVAALGLGAMAPAAIAGPAAAAEFTGNPEVMRVAVAAEPDGVPVALDTAVYAPRDGARHPAVILAHGFGGSRTDADGTARSLASRGYVALAYTARGFGASGGRIHLDDPAVEGEDVRRLIDLLATRPDVQLDAPGDPRVGMTGASYGGAATLIAGGLDARLDALAAAITWNDLADAFFPDYAGATLPAGAPAPTGTSAGGPFKRRWASQFFGAALAAAGGGAGGRAGTPGAAPVTPGVPAGTPGAAAGTPGAAARAAGAAQCGRFEPTICAQFLDTAQSGKASAALLSTLHRHSPSPTNGRVSAPTLLLQGMSDSLFPLSHAEATARQIAAAGTPVAVQWVEGGHDGGGLAASGASTAAPAGSTSSAGGPTAGGTGSGTTTAYDAWFDTYLRGDEPAATRRARPMPVPAFSYSAPAYARGAQARDVSLPGYPGLAATPPAPTTPASMPARAPAPTPVALPFADPRQRGTLLSPPGGDPAATSSIPGLDATAADALGGVAYRLAALPGQSVAFDTTAVPNAVTVVGAPRVRLSVTSTTTDATLFVSLWKVASASVVAQRRQVAPVKVATTPGVPTTVEVALPAGTFALDQGTTWRVLVSASDAAYATPTDARAYTVQLAGDPLSLPTLPGAVEPAPEPDRETIGLLATLAALAVALLLTGAAVVIRRRRGDAARSRTDLADVPLSVSHLVKTYADGHRAVDDVSWRAERGRVVGLLGPNGAGKTTTIRMIVGLIAPDSGEVHVHGRLVHSGSPALAGIGALVEGPGFLPHLSGRGNLEAYWAATGRPHEEARIGEALEVAALGDAVERPVKSYSQGMRQRLGIAQAMLGMPEVLLLDEPTNGLDPPQIAAMRPVLRRYAETGRTVVVSSHLLAEVEMTCSHVVVMHRGRVVLAGSVADLVESADTTVVELGGGMAEAERVAAALRDASGRGGLAGAADRIGRGGASGRWRRGAGLRELHDVRAELVDGAPRLVVHAGDPRPDVARAVLAAGGHVLAFSGRRHLEEVFLGVIAADDLEAARKVRPR